jgi:hypothetical protein
LVRYSSGDKGKGSLKATDISQIFRYTGVVCYFDSTVDYCGADGEYCEPSELCCTDADPDDGIEPPYTDCPTQAVDGACPDGYDAVLTHCNEYVDEWAFNIADFVDLLWDFKNNSYNVQVRFYPLSVQ